VLVAVVSSLQAAPAAGQLAPISSDPALLSAPRPLRLEVLINGVSTHYVEPFVFTPPGRLAIARGDLEDVGIKAPGRGGLRDIVDLDKIDGLKFRYDEAGQKIDFTLSDSQRLARVYDARGAVAKPPPPTADWGAVVNYTLYAASLNTIPAFPRFAGANVTLDARAFSPLGTLNQTAIIGDTVASDSDVLRLDSTFVTSNPDTLETERAGDVISGGLAWTRPIRLGGLQWQRDFTLRSDLITQPMPVINGSAAVPSTVDVFINNVKAFSQDVGTGPYQIVNLPIVSGSGSARVVVTDATGQQVQTGVPFYNSPTLLAKGLTDFSLEGGFARRSYASLSDDYDPNPVASATLRKGLFDEVTLEGHAEAGEGLANAGLGAVASLGQWGTLSAAGAASHFDGAMGYQAFADYNLQFHGFTLNASSQRASSPYSDLASVTATRAQSVDLGATVVPYGVASAASGWDPRPPRALDQISLSAPLPLGKTALTASFINLVDADNTRSRILAASLTEALPRNASLYATVFVDLSNRRDAGVFAGVSIPFGADISTSFGVTASPGTGPTIASDAQKTLQPEDGAYGWHIHDAEGVSPYRAADASYRSSYGTIDVGAQQIDDRSAGTAEIDGSIAALGGGVFLGNRIHDSFAVVDAGVPGVTVSQDNRPIGATNPWGKYLVPDLRSYQANRIGIDPTALPLGGEADSTQKIVAPAGHSGVYVDFGVKKDVRAAIVVLVGPDGKALPPGSKGRLEGGDETFVVGYDGQAYVKRLAATNTVVVENGEQECRASFAYAPVKGKRIVVGPIPCR
jgi:outer membrane usher protein